MSSTVEQVKSKLDIVEVVRGYLKLEKAGQNWKARCPFHNEKTASFFVSPARQSYHCFGCNRGGDLINFVEEIEGLDFISSLKMLADRAGVQLESLRPQTQNSSETNERELLSRVLESARDYYAGELQANHVALDYLRLRGLTPETITSFQLGLAPDGWQNLCQFLQNKRFSESVMIKSGLALRSEKNNSIYDRFRSRIMFPISDQNGRVAGFSGRIFGPETEKSGGKYVNSPETPLYSKSRILYGYDKAKVAIRRENQCVVVEGQMDLLLSHQAGFGNTVAVSGTALTAEQLALIKRLTDNLVMAFDGDEAGVSAASRSINLALSAGFNVRLVAMPEKKDPAELILEDKKLWQELLENAKLVIDFLLDNLASKKLEKLALIHEIEKIVYPYLAALKNTHDVDHYIGKVAMLTQLPENSIREKLRAVRANLVASSEISERSEKTRTTEEIAKSSRKDKILASLFGLYWLGEEEEKLAGKLKSVLGDKFAETEEKLLARKAELILTAELSYEDMAAEKLAQELEELFTNLSLEVYQAEVEALRFRLSREPDNEQDILENLQKVYKKISDLKNKK